MKLDQEKHAALCGVPARRRDTICDPILRPCECCGAETYFSGPAFARAQKMAKEHGRIPVPVCFNCAEPFFQAVAAGEGAVAGPLGAIEENLPDILERRKRYLESTN